MDASMLRGVLFDKDGTLFDFHGTWMPVYRRAAAMVAKTTGRAGIEDRLLKAAGYDAELDRCLPRSLLAAGTTREIAELWSREAGNADHGLAERIRSMFDADAPAMAVPVKDLQGVLERLNARGLVLGVATMDSLASARAMLSRLNIDARFRFVCGYDSGHGHKPGRGMVDAFCAEVAIPPAEIVLVGDTLHDLDMGRTASVGRVVGVLTGSSTREQLSPHCDAVIEGIHQLEALLDGWQENVDA